MRELVAWKTATQSYGEGKLAPQTKTTAAGEWFIAPAKPRSEPGMASDHDDGAADHAAAVKPCRRRRVRGAHGVGAQHARAGGDAALAGNG